MKQVNKNWNGAKVPLHTFIYDELDDNLYVRDMEGHLEKMKVRQNNLIIAVSTLLTLLVNKNMLTDKELANILNLYEDSFEIEETK